MIARRVRAFPTLVLPLHALPNTQLARRLKSEGRLFDGSLVVQDEDRTDTATVSLAPTRVKLALTIEESSHRRASGDRTDHRQ